MKRLVFTFGTLYEDEIIKALLGKIPQNFYATLHGYSIYQAGYSQLPNKVKEFFSTRNYDLNTFSYLYVKQDSEHNSAIEGRAYYIDLEQEMILDHWELYPDWYRKKAVSIKVKDGTEHEAFVYTVDYEGKKLNDFKRVVNNPEKVIVNAKETRKRVIEKFPKAFSH